MFSVARYTFKEIIRSRLLLNVLILGFAIVLVSFVAAEFSYGVPAEVALNFGLGALTLSTVGISIFIGSGLLHHEIENRTVYVVLSRRPSRWQFLVGKFLGLGAFLFLNISLLSVMAISMYFYFGGEWSWSILWSAIFIYCEGLILLSVVVFFGLITNLTMSVIYTLSIYVLGHALTNTLTLNFVENRPELKGFIAGMGLILPNLSKINFKSLVLYDHMISAKLVSSCLIYAIVYTVSLMTLSAVIFTRKDLD